MPLSTCYDCTGPVHSGNNRCLRCGLIQESAYETVDAKAVNGDASYDQPIEVPRPEKPHRLHRLRRQTASGNSRSNDSLRPRRIVGQEEYKAPKKGLSPLVKQSLLTAVFLFVMLLAYQFIGAYMQQKKAEQLAEQLAQSAREFAEESARKKIEDLESSSSIMYIPQHTSGSTCHEWAIFHSKKDGGYEHRIRHCVSNGYY